MNKKSSFSGSTRVSQRVFFWLIYLHSNSTIVQLSSYLLVSLFSHSFISSYAQSDLLSFFTVLLDSLGQNFNCLFSQLAALHIKFHFGESFYFQQALAN